MGAGNKYSTIQDQGNQEDGYVFLADMIKQFQSAERPQVAGKFGRRSKSNAVNTLHTQPAEDETRNLPDSMQNHPGLKQLKHTKSVKEYSHKFKQDRLGEGD